MAQSIEWLGSVAWARRDYVTAASDFRQALAIRDGNMPRDQERIAVTAANLGDAYYELVRYADAEPLYQRVVDIRDKASPQDPQKLPLALSRLGQLYNQMSRTAEAEPLFRRAFDIGLKAYGADNPAMWDSYSALGVMCQERRSCSGRSGTASGCSVRNITRSPTR